MAAHHLLGKASAYLEKLCVEIDNRHVGSPGNRTATAFFADTVSDFGLETETPPFDCPDWQEEGATLTADGETFTAFPSPNMLGCAMEGPLVVVSSVAELSAVELGGRILLMEGSPASEQLMPKNFPFYNPERHQQLYRLLEEKLPLAIIAATGRDLQMVGSQYPFPLIEDGDFDIPSVHTKDVEGERLTAFAGRELSLETAPA